MRLILLRHAIAEELPQAPALEDRPPRDFDRRLTPEGRGKLRCVLRTYARQMEAPSAIYTSPLVRARQTAAVAGRILDVPVQLAECLRPGGDAYSWLRSLEDQHLMVVGHEPDLSWLGAQFLGLPAAPFALKKSGIAALDGVPGHGKLLWLLTPRWMV